MLGTLTRECAPESMVVSFKLETDQSLLINKARCREFFFQMLDGMEHRDASISRGGNAMALMT